MSITDLREIPSKRSAEFFTPRRVTTLMSVEQYRSGTYPGPSVATRQEVDFQLFGSGVRA